MKFFLLYPLFVLCFYSGFIHSVQRSDQSSESTNGAVKKNDFTKCLGEVYTGSSIIDMQSEGNNQADKKTRETEVFHEPNKACSHGKFVDIAIDDSSNDGVNGKAKDEIDANSNEENQEEDNKSPEEQVETGVFQGNYSLYGILFTIKAIPKYLLRLIGY